RAFPNETTCLLRWLVSTSTPQRGNRTSSNHKGSHAIVLFGHFVYDGQLTGKSGGYHEMDFRGLDFLPAAPGVARTGPERLQSSRPVHAARSARGDAPDPDAALLRRV